MYGIQDCEEFELIKTSDLWIKHIQEHSGAELIKIGVFDTIEEQKWKKILNKFQKTTKEQAKKITFSGCNCGLLIKKEENKDPIVINDVTSSSYSSSKNEKMKYPEVTEEYDHSNFLSY